MQTSCALMYNPGIIQTIRSFGNSCWSTCNRKKFVVCVGICRCANIPHSSRVATARHARTELVSSFLLDPGLGGEEETSS